ncbi:MAG: hypothetical protein SOW18_01535 [Peptoniphilus sp.]|nr:hypothetical protein [Peptoniphilus sp.]MDY3118201.1 hypothetical protein [Peptoniphilus sp.]
MTECNTPSHYARFQLFLKSGKVFEIGENDWIGARVGRDMVSGSLRSAACNTKKTLYQALSAGKWLFIKKESGNYAIAGGDVVEAKAMEDGKETIIWRSFHQEERE